MINYTDTTTLVTGAASGIGKALAQALGARGAQVLCADRDFAGAQETAAAIGGGSQAIECDLSDPSVAPPELELVYPEQCAGIALQGMDKNLFYIPTQAHLLDDMQPRMQEIKNSLEALGIERSY